MIKYKPESENLEYKESLAEKFDAVCDICALANKNGGILHFGRKNNGSVIGIDSVSEKTIRDLSNLIFDNIDPKLITTVSLIDIEGKNVIQVEVPKSQTPFHSYKAQAYIRVGTNSRKLDTMEYQKRLIQNKLVNQDYSSNIIKEASLSDISTTAITRLRQLIKNARRTEVNLDQLSDEQLLTDLGLYQDNKITVAALILLGKDTSLQRFLPFSDIRYGYKERMHDIRNQDMAIFAEGYLLYYDKLLNKINTRNLDINIPVGMQLISRKMFEEETIREAVNNAVIHRDYLTNESTFITQSSSKIVLKSPGGFLEGVNPDNIIDQTKTRNKLIANVLFKCGFVEQFGNGINLIYKNQLTAGKNLPSFSDSDDNHVVIDIDGTVQDIEFAQYIFKIAFEKNRELSDYELITLNNIKNNKKIKSSDITEALLSLELIEKLSPQRYILSRKYYASTNNKAAFTLKVGINKEERKMLILKHLEHYKKGVMSEFSQLMKDISTDTIYGYLCELRDMGKIKFVGNRQITKGKNKGFWELV